jgi:hypothetical protein
MSTLSESVETYLQLRRDLGFKLVQAAGWLRALVAFMEARHADVITTELALAWARQPGQAQPPPAGPSG